MFHTKLISKYSCRNKVLNVVSSQCCIVSDKLDTFIIHGTML